MEQGLAKFYEIARGQLQLLPSIGNEKGRLGSNGGTPLYEFVKKLLKEAIDANDFTVKTFSVMSRSKLLGTTS